MKLVNRFFFRVFLLTACLLYNEAINAYDFEVNGFSYKKLSSNQVEITKSQNKTGELNIPEKVKYDGVEYSVTSIGNYAFDDCSGLTGSLTIPSSVKTIGDGAFWACSGFTGSLIIPSSVISIGNTAFSGCSGFTGSLIIPNSIKTIGHDAFYGCSGFTGSLTIPNSVTSISDRAFSICSGFTGSLTIPSSVTSIGDRAFSGCSGFTGSLTIPSSVTSIGEAAFSGCSGFTGSLTIPNSVTTIGDGAFFMCSGLTGSLSIPNSVTTIGEGAFRECRGLNGTLTISSSVTTIGNSAFMDCDGLSGLLIIPNKVTNIGEFAFSGCSGFTGSLVIPNSVTTIGRWAFQSCSGLTSATLHGSVTSIATEAFKGCKNIVSVISYIENPFNIDAVFANISSYAKLEVPKGTKSKYQALSGWANYFKEIVEMDAAPTTYTLSITASGNGSAFYSGSTIRSKTSTFTVNEGSSATITFTPDNGYRIKSVKVNNSTVSVSNNKYTISSINANTTVSVEFESIPVTTYTLSITASANGSVSYGGTTIRNKTSNFTINAGLSATINFTPDNGYRIKTVKVNNSTVSVSNNQYTINNMNQDISVDVEFEETPVFLSNVEVGGFYYNLDRNAKTAELTYKDKTYRSYSGYINIPSSVFYEGNNYIVTPIGEDCFSFCNITSVTIPQTVTHIGIGAFNMCDITSIIVPNSVNSINHSAFYGCRSLTKVTISEGLLGLSANIFAECSSLTSVIIPNNIKEIGAGAFKSCSNLSDVSISTNLTSIGNYAFSDCESLSSVIIPSGVNHIGYGAFMDCRNLDFVNSYIETPYDIDNVFSRISSSAILQVPKGTKSKYLTFTGWTTNFKEIVEFADSPTTYTLSITASGNGSASYGGTTIRSKTSSFTVNEGANVAITITPDNGYRIKSLKENNTLVTSYVSNNKYTINSISRNTTVEIEFEAIPPTTYTLSITVSGNGSATYDGTSIRENTKSFTVEEGANAIITLSPDEGYKVNIAKTTGNNTSNLYNNTLTFSNIKNDLAVEIEFLPIPTYTLSITASGNGSASYNETTIRSKTSSFKVNEGSSATISFTPDEGCQIKDVKVNGSVVTINNRQYSISRMSRNTTVEVEFEETMKSFSVDDVNYTVVSGSEHTIRLAKGNYDLVLEVPEKVSFQDVEWTVTGIDNGALANNTGLAAIIWNPEAAFTEQISNPNLLLYVNKAQYAPSGIQNVVVNGTAQSIILKDATSGNNFHCPQEFTAQRISYTHNYSMETGIGEAKGWETIALPFDVQKVTHESKGEIVSFANWKSGDSKRPFWLMQLSGSGWTLAESIKANTPYIISMPNNQEYKSGFLLDGNVTFSADNVTIPKTVDLKTANYGNRTFVPTFVRKEKSNGVLALNVKNDIENNTNSYTEGSTFVYNLRPVHPFEAYMTTTASVRSIGIDEGMATGIMELIWALSDDGRLRIYNLNGQLIKIEEGRSQEEVIKELPAGVYIVNGKKLIIK